MTTYKLAEKLMMLGLSPEFLEGLALQLMRVGTSPVNALYRHVNWIDRIGKNMLTLAIKLDKRNDEPERRSVSDMLLKEGVDLKMLEFCTEQLASHLGKNAYDGLAGELVALLGEIRAEHLPDS